MAGTNVFTPISATCWVGLTEAEGESDASNQLAMFAKCTGTPPVTANVFEHGCIMNQTDSGTGVNAVFQNTGSSAVPVWTLFDTAVGGPIPLTNSHIFVGNAGNIATDAPMSKDGTMANNGALTVVGLQGRTILAAAPNTNDVLTFDGTFWGGSPGQTAEQYKDEGVNLGTAGTVNTVNFVGTGVTATRVGNAVTVTVPGSTGGLSQFGYFWQSVADVAATIAANNGKALFHSASSNNTSGFTMVADSGNITVLNAGVYEIDWSLSAAEPGAMCVYVNNTKEDVAGGTYGSGAGTQQNTGKTLLTLAANDVISLRTDNCPAALTLQLAGTTNTNEVVASIMLKKVA